MASIEEPPQAGIVTLRSTYISSPATDDGELQSLAASGGDNNDDVTQRLDVSNTSSDRFDESKTNGSDNEEDESDEDALDPIQLPQSTHSLLFTSPVLSLPFAFAIFILSVSIFCLVLAFANNATTNDIPVNVTWSVRGAQYLSIIVALLMEEEIPTGLYLLRMIPKQSLKQKFPQMKYRKFIFSSVLRICLGYIFLANILLVLTQATGVIDIFYNLLALQFIESLDDVAFNLCKMDVLGKTLQRACTAKCFRAEFDRQTFGRSKYLSTFFKTIYFINLCVMVFVMVGYVSVRQIRGDLHDPSITADFGNTVYASSWVKVPSWVPAFQRETPGQEYEEWPLVYANFNGVYVKDRIQYGRPIYKEANKNTYSVYSEKALDFIPGYEKVVVPAEIKYCKEIKAWVFTHEDIYKSKSATKAGHGCNWLLRSPETEEFDLLNVVGDWQVWVGVIGKAEVSITTNRCKDISDCNLNGECVDGQCVCKGEDGVQFFGTHCEIQFRDRCRTIIGEDFNETYSVLDGGSGMAVDSSSQMDSIVQQYSRPYYMYVGGDPDLDKAIEEHGNALNSTIVFFISYAGNRWVGSFDLGWEETDWSAVMKVFEGAHGFWDRYFSSLASYISDPTTASTPVGVDFYLVGERGEQFGTFGALYPTSNQTGRGYFRCSDSDLTSDLTI